MWQDVLLHTGSTGASWRAHMPRADSSTSVVKHRPKWKVKVTSMNKNERMKRIAEAAIRMIISEAGYYAH
jgi:hypothetical protein